MVLQTSIRTKQDILNALHRNLSRLKALGVEQIGLFGSFIRGEQRDESDINLLVKFEPDKKTFDGFTLVVSSSSSDRGGRTC